MIVVLGEYAGSSKTLFQSIFKSISIVTSIPSIHYQPRQYYTMERVQWKQQSFVSINF